MSSTDTPVVKRALLKRNVWNIILLHLLDDLFLSLNLLVSSITEVKTETTWHPITTTTKNNVKQKWKQKLLGIQLQKNIYIYIKIWRDLKNIGFPLWHTPLAVHPSKSLLCFEHIARLWFPTSLFIRYDHRSKVSLWESESSRNDIKHQAWPIKTPYIWFSTLFPSSWLVNWSPGKVANHLILPGVFQF